MQAHGAAYNGAASANLTSNKALQEHTEQHHGAAHLPVKFGIDSTLR
jgi:hypothetical protein